MAGFSIEGMNRVSGGGAAGGFERLSETKSLPNDKDEKSFGNVLKNLVDDVKETQDVANKASEELVAGRNKDIHGAMIAMEKADVSLRLLMQVRNKVIDAYREIMKMQI